ncbi:DUF262 domain-containing protein [Geodermatophilus dictyosporus]|uniref:DUF262 domain-containing protein n=1 Tax=Geodermatophilus dictyosporus TaxID=1523247 RepID=UPI00244E8ACC|nr:DUF262 domain-containing protein [Geodermatophilus dictyosporus]
MLDEGRCFRVPRYQRAYAWELDDVDDLCDDIEAVVATQDGRGTLKGSHFFGTLVTVLVPETAASRSHYHEVVDGQQRLTTFCLFLRAIAMRATQEAESAKAEQDRTAKSFSTLAQETESFLRYNDFDVAAGTVSQQPRLSLSLVDDPYFQDLLSKESLDSASRDSHKRLLAAFNRLDERLIEPIATESTYKAKLKRLTAIRDSLLVRGYVIHVTSNDRASGYTLFSVLNNRGQDLTNADLLRNHTLEALNAFPKAQEKAARAWDRIAGSANVDAFLRAYYPSVAGRRASQDKLFEDVRQLRFPKRPQITADADDYVATVERLGAELDVYKSLMTGDWPFASPVASLWQRDRLRRLIISLRHELAIPLLLSASTAADETGFADLVHMLELFAFRYKNICNAHATPAANAYYRAARAARTSHATRKPVSWKDLRADLRDLLNTRAGAAIFASQLDELSYEYQSDKTLLRELLTTIEDYHT